MSQNPNRIQLPEVLPHTATSVEITPDGSVVVEHYDFSPDAHNSFGGDVAFQLLIDAGDKELLLSSLIEDSASTEVDRDELLLNLIKERFKSYFQIKTWLREKSIPHREVETRYIASLRWRKWTAHLAGCARPGFGLDSDPTQGPRE